MIVSLIGITFAVPTIEVKHTNIAIPTASLFVV